MLHEYAVEPSAIGSSWGTFRYVFEKFGFDQDRLISRFPKKWPRLVWDATQTLGPVERKRIEEALNLALRSKIIKSTRAYDSNAADWLQEALVQDALSPFHAIITRENPTNHNRVLRVDDLDERQSLMVVQRDWSVRREPRTLANAMELMLQTANVVLFIDPYYDPFNARYQSTLRECLKIIHTANPSAICEIHHLDVDDGWELVALESQAKDKFDKVIPEGMTIEVYRWREMVGGEDFHARYLLTDNGGIRIDAGFSAEGGHQTTDMNLMDIELSQQKRSAFNRNAHVFELIEPVLQISWDGDFKHL
jgi:hypothetical protein